MSVPETYTYEKIYLSLWELAQRYHSFTEFRVIGESHDERKIPMLEIGEGNEVVFCLAGVYGTEQIAPVLLLKMSEEYCQAYEYDWAAENFYHIRHLLKKIRLCMIPMLNPDGYEICRKGYRSIRNPIYRQMLKMKRIPREEFFSNARAVDIGRNFPTFYCNRQRIDQEPASENETKAFMRILQEYTSRGLLSFNEKEEGIVYCRQAQKLFYNQKSDRIARQLQKCFNNSGSIYAHITKNPLRYSDGIGSPEQFYAEKINKPSLEIEIPYRNLFSDHEENELRYGYEQIRLLPLEYLYSLDE